MTTRPTPASATVPLDPDMPAQVGFARVLSNLADAIETNRDGTLSHADPEFLHQLRIAVRRSRTVLAEGKQVLPTDLVETARERFGRIGALTGPARDLDVYLIEWDGYTEPLGPDAAALLAPVRGVLEERQAAAHADLDAVLDTPEARQSEGSWRTALDELSDPRGAGGRSGEHAERPLGPVVVRRIERAQKRLVRHGRAIGPDSPAEQVHDLRKDAKRLRYLLECFGSLLPDKHRRRFVKRLKALQENLGIHQDAEIHVALIRELVGVLGERETPPETLVAMGQLLERLDQIRASARADFTERFAAYDTAATQARLDRVLAPLR